MNAGIDEEGDVKMIKKTTTASFTCLLITTLLIVVVSTGCNSPKKGKPVGSTGDDGKTTVAVSTYPLLYFTQRIAGDHVDVVFPVADDGMDGDPAFWKPSSSAVATMQKASRVLINGAGYETWLQTVTLSDSSVVSTSDGFKQEWISQESTVTHQHGPEGEEHSHGEIAWTTWLNPEYAVQQARKVCDELGSLQPDHKQDFETAFAALEKDLRDLRKQMSEIAPGLSGQHVVGSHPVYQYLQQAMNLNMSSVVFEPDADPSAEQWKEFDELLKENPSSLMLWEGEPTATTQKELANRNIKVVVFDPLGNQPAEGDYLSGMKKNLERLKNSLGE